MRRRKSNIQLGIKDCNQDRQNQSLLLVSAQDKMLEIGG